MTSPVLPLLELRGIACRRGARLLLSGLDLALPAGQWLRVRGANGSGKTSLLRVACGLQPPAAGQVLWRGEPVDHPQALAGSALFIGHGGAAREELPALDNLRWACALMGRPVDAARGLRALQEAGLGDCARRPWRALSQGQRRRCALARLPLATGWPLWVLDEPLDGLDAAGADWLDGLLRRHLAGGGVAVLTSHVPLALERLAHQELAL